MSIESRMWSTLKSPPLSYYIFSTMDGQNMNGQFITTMKIYIFNSFLYCAHIATNGIIWFSTTTVMYENNEIIFSLFPSYEVMFYYAYIFHWFTVWHYTFAGIMDIYIAYIRILIFKPTYEFLKKTSVSFTNVIHSIVSWLIKFHILKLTKVSLIIIFISVLITLPINISRQVVTYKFELNTTNTSLTLYTYGMFISHY